MFQLEGVGYIESIARYNKRNANAIDKYKARLMAKRCIQKEGVDYKKRSHIWWDFPPFTLFLQLLLKQI